MRFPLLGKVVGVAAVTLGLWIALNMVSGVVREREARLREAQGSVAESLAGRQRLVGPLMQRRCEETWTNAVGEGKESRTVDERREFLLATTPRTLDVDARAALEARYRGIFKVNGYVLKATLAADWSDLAALRPRAEHPGSRLSCDAPVVVFGVGDVRGLRQVALHVAGAQLDVLPGTPRKHLPQGFHAVVPAAVVDAAGPVRIELALELVGTGALDVAPVGDATSVKLASDWPHPSFQGRFLPIEREIGPQGFKATWRVSALASSAPRDLLEGVEQVEAFGIGFIDPVNVYVLGDRATKYGVLFILLTFVGIGLVEVLRRVRVHPIQYLLVGCAMTLFFLLLVSLSEHVAFGWAYLTATAACTLLCAFYGAFALRGWRTGVGLGAALGALYGALYLLLQLEQTALLLGTLLLFAVLSAVMVVTRRLDWYGLFDPLRAPAGPAAVSPQRP